MTFDGMNSPKAQTRAAAGLRSFFLSSHTNIPQVSVRQKALNAEKAVKGPIWVSRTGIPPPPEHDLDELLWQAVQQLGDGEAKITKPEYAAEIGANWTGHRPGVSDSEPEPRIPEDEKFRNLMAAVGGSTKTIFFLQGGSLAFGSPVTARPFVKKLALSTKLRILTVAYRLAPAYTFPAFLLDALVAYFTLLSPPPGSFHDPVPASSIVLAGESAGASIALAIVQTLLHFRRNGIQSISFNGRSVPVELPTGVAALSPPGDQTVSLPSRDRFRETDWTWSFGPWLAPNCPTDELWPSNPPRGEIYADTSALTHPLLSLAAARDWTGAPPLLVTTGQEAISDGTLMIAQTAAQQDVPVQFMQYEGMPHLFMFFLTSLPQSSHVVKACIKFCLDVLQGSKAPSDSNGTFFKLGAMQASTLDTRRLLSVSSEEARNIMEDGRRKRMAWVWSGPSDAKASASSQKL